MKAVTTIRIDPAIRSAVRRLVLERAEERGGRASFNEFVNEALRQALDAEKQRKAEAEHA